MAGTIGIKLANGNFFPIMKADTSVKKRLVLTTVHDSQESVQIDLFKSVSKSMLNAQYIGSLLVEDIGPRPKGEPSIEMVISAGEDGTITADACDLDAGPNSEHHTLNVSLKTEDSSKSDRFPDFDLEGKRQTPTGLYGRAEFEKEEERKYPWLIIALASVFVIVVVALLWFFFLGGRDQIFTGSAQGYQQTAPVTPPPPPPPPPVEKIEPVAPPPPEPPKPVEPAPVIEAPTAPPPARPQTVQRTRPPAPVSSYKVPAVIPKNGVAYQIRWGDTLWDISEAFYRNPWLYPRIARYNNIRNPDLIIAGRTIRIPPRN